MEEDTSGERVNGQTRTLQEVETIREYAKLDRSELRPVVQCLGFSSVLDNHAFSLLELDKDTLGLLQKGDRLVIRGDKADSAVLCTKGRTFELRAAETSNSMLVLPGLQMPDEVKEEELTLKEQQVCGVKYEYYELRSVRPRLKRLKELLEENVYSGPECEQDENHQGKKYTFSELLEHVQASEAEVQQGIQTLQAVHLQGFVRLLDFDFISKVISQVLSLIDEQSWSFDCVPVSESCEVLQELYPREIVQHILYSYSDSQQNTDGAAEDACRLNEDKICRFFAEMVLRPFQKFNLESFENVWQLSVPEGMKTHLCQLEGLALIHRDSHPQVIEYFPLSNLPEDVNDRFNYLFKTKEKWPLAEITPYIKDLTTEKQTVSVLLTKYARSSTQNGIKMYSSKKPLK